MALAAQLLVGNLVGHYRILSQVGAGGMGVVFKAQDLRLERTVALKFLTPDPACSVADRKGLLHEARAASTLDHKNIATIHAVEETDDGQPFIVMAYYEGQSLAASMQDGPLLPEEAIWIVGQIAEGLAHAHLHNLVHRDIKPSNVILTTEGDVKIVDFGLARFVSAGACTQTLGLAGTLYYMSPEQVTGDALDARTDIWSLGVIAYQMLTNRLPFWGSNAASILEAILHATPPEIEDAPQEVRTIVNRMLSKTRGDRYQSCAELLGDLQILPIQAGGVNHKSESSGRNHAVTLDSGEPVRSLGHRHWRLLVIAALLVLAALSPPVRNGWVRAVAQSMGRLVGHGSKESTADVGRGAAPAAYETYLKGRGYLERYDKPGNLDAAIHAFETTTRTDPRFALAFAALGEAYWDKYRFDQDPQWIQQASSYCRRAAELNDKLPAVHITLGRIHDGTGEHQLALQEFQRALELDDGNADAQLGMADAYAGMGRNREAEETYKRAVAMRPENWDGQYRLGISYFHQGRFAEAASQFRRVIELTPTMRRRIRALVPRWFS